MAVACGVSFGVCAIRVTLLDELGVVQDVADNSYVSDKMTSVQMSPDVEQGTTFSRKNGCGCSLARFRTPDIFNFWTFTFEDGALEPELEALMLANTGVHTIVDGSDVVGVGKGVSDSECGEASVGVGFEVWTKHIVGGGIDGAFPYIHWVFPFTQWQRGDNTAEEDFMANQLTGFSSTNQMWGGGPYNDGPPDGSDISDYGYWKTPDTLPTAACGATHVEPGS
jgi:hypothetical protein